MVTSKQKFKTVPNHVFDFPIIDVIFNFTGLIFNAPIFLFVNVRMVSMLPYLMLPAPVKYHEADIAGVTSAFKRHFS